MYSRTFEATSGGEAAVDLYGYDSNIEISAEEDCFQAYVEVYTEASSGPSVEAIDALPDVRGNNLRVHLPKGTGGGGVTIVSGGGFTSSMISVGGSADMMVNGQRIQVRNGRTYVNGQEVGAGSSGASGGDPALPIHFRAVVPYGSRAEAETYNGDITALDVAAVRLKTYNGNVKATGLAAESKVKTYSGNIAVGAASGLRPEVRAETYNGDITALDDDIRLRPKTYNGDVRYPR